MADGRVRVAVVGAGDIGRGWAALCVANGWPVTLYDNESETLSHAMDDVGERAQHLVQLDHATVPDVEEGLGQLAAGRSLLQACQEAEWVIEAIHEDLIAKQKLFEGLESAALKARVITSSTSTLSAGDIVARCRRPDRVLVAHPMNPPELIPLVEVLVHRQTDGAIVEIFKGWLRALGRIPVTLRKPVRGNIANRIAAAVWRECIQLVLDDVIGVDDLDRAVSLGPGLAWAAAGPHLSYHLAAGSRGMRGFLQQLAHTFEEIWGDLASWEKLEPEQQQRLSHAIEKAYAENLEVIRKARDRRLAALLRVLDAKRGS